MSFSYSNDPNTSTLDEVRFLLGDTDSALPLLTDEEISYYIDKLDLVYNDASMTAAFCAEVVAAKYAGEVAISADGVTYSGDQLQTKFQALALQLRNTYASLRRVGAEPYAGGILNGELLDPTVKPLMFGIGKDDNDRAGSQAYGQRQEGFQQADAVDPGDFLW